MRSNNNNNISIKIVLSTYYYYDCDIFVRHATIFCTDINLAFAHYTVL